MTANAVSLSGSEWAERWVRRDTSSLDDLADEELAAKAQAGSSDHFAKLVRRYAAGVYRVGYLLTGNRQEAEDISQETFIKLFRAFPQYRPDLPFRPWLYRIVVNTARSFGRKRKSRPESGPAPDDGEAPTREAAESAIAKLDAREALRSLPPESWQIVILKAVEGLSFVEISRALDIVEATARTKFHRAKALLRVLLAENASVENAWEDVTPAEVWERAP